jgi:hypothetical protein
MAIHIKSDGNDAGRCQQSLPTAAKSAPACPAMGPAARHVDSFRFLPQAFLALPLAAMLFVQSAAFAQQPPAAPAAPAATSATTSQQELDQLLAPIALYPDALIAQILMASTYPLEVVEAARWAKANPDVKDKALEDAMQKQTWDESVKALTTVPQVLKQMNDNLSWTQKLGDAFLADQKSVLATVQSLRSKASAAGNLKSTAEQTVKTETQEGKTVVVIESAQPEVVYVPTYNPSTIYGPWWYPSYPPYYMYPPGYVYRPGLAFATGVVVGAAIWGGCNWGRGDVNINVNKYNNFNRSNISNTNFNHNVDHRKGVAYKDQGVAQKYDRGGNKQATQSREEFRGRAEQGRQEMGSMDRNELQRSTQQADRSGNRAGGGGASPTAGTRDVGGGGASPTAATRDAGSANRGGGGSSNASRGSSGGGFSGASGGGSTRQASSQGAASRGSAGGGASRGGGGGGGGRRR